MSLTLLLIPAALIILALAGYALSLLVKLRQQRQQRQAAVDAAIARRNANIFASVHTLCLAGIQQQCDLAEISIRVCSMLDYLQGEQRIDVSAELPALFELYQVVKEMARGEARQALSTKMRMQQDLTRYKAESRLTDAIVPELQKLQLRIQPLCLAQGAL